MLSAVILYNIRSVYNVGSIFRTAECAGVGEIILAGYTPTPINEYGLERADVHKTALGAEKLVPWRHFEQILEAIAYARDQGWQVTSLEITPHAEDYRAFDRSKPTALILGNEVDGIEQNVLDQSDSVMVIPIHGRKESLNVSVAFGVAAFAFLE